MSSNRQLFLQHLAQTTEFPLMLEVERAEGIYLYGPNGEKTVDLISGIGVSSLGHNHPAIVKAVKDQVDKHMHVMVYGELIQSPQVELAKALAATLPDPLDNVYFVNSGSEAVEGAIKLAKRYTGRREIISCYSAYHGSTQGALSVAGNESLKQAFRPLIPGVHQIRFGIEEDLEMINEHTAAVIIETFQGEAGVRVAPNGYFKKLRRKCDDERTLLIVDEIQCGFGRTGKFWAFEHYGIVPDLVVSAKGMGGGMPIGAFISRKEIMHSLTNNPMLGHITTFGGHPVSAAASLANLKIIRESGLLNVVETKSQLIHDHLIRNRMVREVRRKGLMMAAEFESFELLQKIIEKMLKNGVLSDWFLFCDNSMRIAPPLIISEDEILETGEKIESVLQKF